MSSCEQERCEKVVYEKSANFEHKQERKKANLCPSTTRKWHSWTRRPFLVKIERTLTTSLHSMSNRHRNRVDRRLKRSKTGCGLASKVRTSPKPIQSPLELHTHRRPCSQNPARSHAKCFRPLYWNQPTLLFVCIFLWSSAGKLEPGPPCSRQVETRLRLSPLILWALNSNFYSLWRHLIFLQTGYTVLWTFPSPTFHRLNYLPHEPKSYLH